MKFKEFIKTKGAKGAIFMGIFYALVMLAIFLPGYKAMPGNINKLPIAIINDDNGNYGDQISKQLNKSLPFDNINKNINYIEANKKLMHNKLNLIIHIPKDFSKNLSSKKDTPGLNFKINDASPTMISQSMDSIGKEINNQLSNQFSNQINNSYSGDISHINQMSPNMNYKMLPMFLTLAVYIGAMIGAMQLVSAFQENRHKTSNIRLFVYVQLTAIIIGLAASLIALGITYLVNDLDISKFFSIFAQSTLNYWVSFNFTAIIVFLIGATGMIVNIPILLIQTISNGATMSRDMMPTLYNWMSYISPMYYSVQGHFANIFGNISQMPYIFSMITIGLVSMLINIAIITFASKKESTEIVQNDKNSSPIMESQ